MKTSARLRPRLLILIGLFLLGLAPRIAVHWQLIEGYPRYYYPPSISDMAIYHNLAVEVAGGNVPQKLLHHNILYYHILGFIYWCGGDQEVMLLLQNLLGACLAPLLFLIAGRYVGLFEAACSGIFAALYKPFIFYDQFLLLESLQNVFFVVLLYFLYVQTSQLLKVLFVPFILGLLHLIRLNAPLLWPAALWNLAMQGFSRRSLILMIALWLPFFFVVPLYNQINGGAMLFGTLNFGENMYMGNNRDSNGTVDYSPTLLELQKVERTLPVKERASFWIRTTLATWDSLWGLVPLFLRKLCLTWGAWEVPNNISMQAMEGCSNTLAGKGILSFGVLAPFGLLGLITLFSSHSETRRSWAISLSGWLLTWTIVISLFIVLGRYRLPMGTILCLAAGSGLHALVSPQGNFVRRALLLLALFLLVNVVINYQAFLGLPLFGFPPSLRY